MRPPGSDLIRSSKLLERLSNDIVGPKPLTRSKNHHLLTVVDEFRFPDFFHLRKITSSSAIKCLSTLRAIFETPGHSPRRGTQFVSSEFQKIGAETSKTTPFHPQGHGKTSATTELCERPFSVCCTPQTAHSLTWNVSYHQRSRRSGHSSIPSLRRILMTASFVSNAVSRRSVPPGAHLGSRQTLPPFSRKS